MTAGTGPNYNSSLLEAAQWLGGLMQGPFAVTLAVLAVAATGLMMLSGRLALRRGLVMTLGCFVLFGAPAIAKELFASAISIAGSSEPFSPIAYTGARPPVEPQPIQSQVADPYAGASVRH